MCAARRSTRRASASVHSRDRGDCGACAGSHGPEHLLRRRHAVADAPATVRRSSTRLALHWRSLRTPRSRSRPTRPASRPTRFRGYRAAGVNRVSLGVQSLATRAQGARPAAYGARGARGGACAQRLPRFSFDLIYARPRQTPRLGGRAQARDRLGRRAPVALPAHHRAGHAVRGACMQPASSRCPTRTRRARSTTRRRRLRARRAAGLRDFQPRAAGRGMPPQSHLLARRTNMPASARARMGG